MTRSEELANVFPNTMVMYGLEVGHESGQVYIDFYSYGGGYKIESKNFHNSGANEPFGGMRRSRKEFMAFLDGLHQSRFFDEHERTSPRRARAA